jgi:hypothetical protein
MTLEEFYTAICHKFEPERLEQVNEDSLTYGTRQYLELFRRKGHKSLFVSRNVSVIFLGPLWFLYRRMYTLAFVIPMLWFIIEYFLRQYNIKENTILLFEIVFDVYVSLFANSLYINNVRRRFAKGFHSTPSRWVIYGVVLGGWVCVYLVLILLKVIIVLTSK